MSELYWVGVLLVLMWIFGAGAHANDKKRKARRDERKKTEDTVSAQELGKNE